jgi:hypothetical protein
LWFANFVNARNDDGEQAPHPGLHIFLFVVFDTSAVILFVMCLCKLLLLATTLLHVLCHNYEYYKKQQLKFLSLAASRV